MKLRAIAITLFACAMLTACGGGGWTPPEYSGHQESTEGVPGFEHGKKLSPYVKLGQSYKVMGEWYVPRHQPEYNEVGLASWYGPGFHGGKTANGEEFDKHSMTAAHKTLPLPSIVKVTMLDTGKSAYVRINDRGPFSKGRIIDLSYAAAKEIGLIRKGVAKVRVEYKLAESQRFAELLAQGRDPEDVDIASEVLPYAGDTKYADKDDWWQRVSPISSAEASEPKTKYKQAPATYAPVAAAVTTNDLPPPALPEPDARTAVASNTGSVFQPIEEVPPAVPSQPAPPASPSQPMPAGGGGLYVQVGTYSMENNARHMAQRVRGVGDVHVTLLQRGDASLYRVRLGPYQNTEMAEDVLARLQQMGLSDARLTKP